MPVGNLKKMNLEQVTVPSLALAQPLLRSEMFAEFDLQHGPLIRAKLFYVQDSDQYVFVIVLHHIIADGWSLGLLEAQLQEMYNDRAYHHRVASNPREL